MNMDGVITTSLPPTTTTSATTSTRTSVANSPTTTATTSTPRSTTTNGGPSQSPYAVLNLDLVIAIDASATMPMANFNEVVTFLKTVLIPYTIGQGYPGTRVSIIDVPGDNGFLVPSNTLQSIANRDDLLRALDNANEFYDGSTGQQFVALLQEVIRPEFTKAGYRADITNHLLLYITGTSTFTDDTDGTTAAAFAQTIRSHKTYGIIIIAYKAATVDVNALQTIAGGADCVLQATTNDQLYQQGIPLIQSKTLAGQYCGM
uniref:VWFA domain-containing protein n=1 Tax=Plectus sambesii TaxID=2011161 RepID=A0A914WD40_9BILA